MRLLYQLNTVRNYTLKKYTLTSQHPSCFITRLHARMDWGITIHIEALSFDSWTKDTVFQSGL